MRIVAIAGLILLLGLSLCGPSTAQDRITHGVAVPSEEQRAGIESRPEANGPSTGHTSREEMIARLRMVDENDGTGIERCEKIRLLHALGSGAGRDASVKAEPIRWDNQEQKAHCESLLGKLRNNFLSARYHSIQGDSCATARYAGAFLGLIDTCTQECPEGFLGANDYSARIIRNLSWLNELGSKRCLEGSK